LKTMDSMVAAAWSAHGMPSCPPGLELPQDSVWDVPTPRAPEQAPGSGGRTPDFVTARGWPANAGDSAQHSDGADTPRDATAGAMLIMDQVCSKLRSLELETRGALSKPLAETAQKVPMPYGLLSRAAAPILTTAPPAYAAAGDACRPPPGLPLPPTHHSPVPPPPPEPVVPRASAKMTFAHPKFVVSYGSVGHPLQCGGMCQRDDCELGAQCPSCHICRAEEAAAQARQLDEAQKVDDQCASVGSIGHPYTCAEACKFHPKPRGCKDGALCTRCHVCRWNRYQKKGLAQHPMRNQAFSDFLGR